MERSVRNPRTGLHDASLKAVTPAELAASAQALRSSAAAWSRRGAAERARVLLDWREHGAAWALIGELSQTELLRLAEKAYRALNS